MSDRLNITHRINFSNCGVNDCQDQNYTFSNLEQYSPAFPATRYVVITMFSLFLVVAIFLHAMFLPNDYPFKRESLRQFDLDDSDVKLENQRMDEKKAEIANGNELIIKNNERKLDFSTTVGISCYEIFLINVNFLK